MHSRLSDPRVLELLLLEEAAGEAAGEADPEAEESPRTPESESDRIWNAAESELNVVPMAVSGSELIRRAGGCSESCVEKPKLLLLLAPAALVAAVLLLLPANPKSVDQMLG